MQFADRNILRIFAAHFLGITIATFKNTLLPAFSKADICFVKNTSFFRIALLRWLITAALFGCLKLNAQELWDLKQCIQYGLENHKTNEIYKGNIEKARQMKNENLALYYPQISGDLRFEDYLDLQTMIIPEGTSLGGLPPTDKNQEIQFGTKFQIYGTLDAEQMLYNRLLLVSLRGLKPNTAIANLNFQQNQENLIYNISQAYLQARILKLQIDLLSENEQKFANQLKIIKLQVEKGVAKKMDGSRISVALNNITSQLDVAKSGYEVAVNRLKNALGMEISNTIVLSDSTRINTIDNVPEAFFDANNKTEILLQQNQLKLLEVQKKRAGAGYFPTLSFYARYSVQAYNNEFASAFREWYDFSSFGLKLHVPIFDGMQSSAQKKQQIINMRNAQLNLEMSQQAFQLQHQNATSQLKRARVNLENNETNVALAKEVFDAIALMHQQGVTLLSEFLNAETAYKESQLNYITAMLNYYTAVIELEKAKGTLNEFYQKL